MWSSLRVTHMVPDNLCRIRRDGSHSHSYDEYDIFRPEYDNIPNISISGFCLPSQDNVHRSGMLKNVKLWLAIH